jgi:zinc protease
MTQPRYVSGMLIGLAGLLALPLSAQPPRPETADPVARAVAVLYEGIREETLPNGLRIYLKPIDGAPIVTVMTAYRVGSADEEANQTGLSHYLEHLMFKGTERLMPGDIDRLTRRAGGQNNAYTTQDFTNFHFDFAAEKWETALEIEADRMRNLRIDDKHEFQQEKGAVISELEGNEDEPYELENKAILPLLFGPKTPYGHPIIGEKTHVRGATAAIIKAHYDRWYHPNNACMVIVGGFDADRAIARIKELFGPIPRVELPPRPVVKPVVRTSPAVVEIPSKFEADRCVMGFNTCKVGDPDDYALDVIEHILSSGKTGRLYRRLVLEQEVAGEVKCTNQAGKLPGWFAIEMEVMKGTDRKKAEKALLAELEILSRDLVSAEELRRVERSVVAGLIFQREGMHELADGIVNAVATTGLDYVKTYLPRIQSVKAEEVRQVARKYFDPNKRAVAWSVVSKKPAEKPEAPPRKDPDKVKPPGRPAARAGARLFDKVPARAGGAEKIDLAQARRVVLDNGLTLLLLENRRLPIIYAEAQVKRVRLFEPADKAGVMTLVGMLLEEGTDRRSEFQIAQAIEDTGGVLHMTGSGGTVKFLAPDRKLGLGLLLECLTRPAFKPDAVKRLKEHLLSEIDDNRQQPQTRAQDEFLKMIYGDHPLGRSVYGTEESVEGLTVDDCRKFHQAVFVPNNTVLAIVGDFETQAVIEELTALTRDWKKRDLPKLNLNPPLTQEKLTQRFISIPGAAQLNVYMGHLGIGRANPDYYKLLVMDNILGVGTGFTDRLSARLRDRNGLAYTVTASITGTAGEEAGVFSAFIGTYADKLPEVKKMMLEEIRRMCDEKPTAVEVDEAKGYLLGTLPFRLASNEDLAGQLLLIERYDLGLDYLNTFRKTIAAVSVDDVHAAARKHLHPDRLVLVAAGPISEKGEPLSKEDGSGR